MSGIWGDLTAQEVLLLSKGITPLAALGIPNLVKTLKPIQLPHRAAALPLAPAPTMTVIKKVHRNAEGLINCILETHTPVNGGQTMDVHKTVVRNPDGSIKEVRQDGPPTARVFVDEPRA